MRKFLIPSALAGCLIVGGCASSPYGYGGGDPLAGILQSVLGGGSGSNRNLSQFERAAVEACGREASRYGRVSIADVRTQSRDTVAVYGRVETTNRSQREFGCAFRSDGRIVDFQIS